MAYPVAFPKRAKQDTSMIPRGLLLRDWYYQQIKSIHVPSSYCAVDVKAAQGQNKITQISNLAFLKKSYTSSLEFKI